MKQKDLTKKQLEVLERLEAVFKEAQENNIGFVFDSDDCSLNAFNAENVNLTYCGRNSEEEEDEKMNWDFTHWVRNFNADYFDYQFDDYYLNFK